MLARGTKIMMSDGWSGVVSLDDGGDIVICTRDGSNDHRDCRTFGRQHLSVVDGKAIVDWHLARLPQEERRARERLEAPWRTASDRLH